jgi:cytidine deaminase
MPDYPQDLFNAAKAILHHAYAPYSNFLVAASVRTRSGRIFSGINVENASYSLTCCAEKNAITNMAGAGEREIAESLILVPGPGLCPPCGACRQILHEFAVPNCPIHLCTEALEYKRFSLEELLPFTFSSRHF